MFTKVNRFSFLIMFMTTFMSQSLYAHKSLSEHKNDMYRVLGFQEHHKITEWMEFISSEMIDNCYQSDFYKKLQSDYVDFKCKHRLLFHWGYNEEPWSNSIELKVRDYANRMSLDKDSLVRVFKAAFKIEQKRRNKEINEKTEVLFGFASGGKDAAIANFFAAIVYDVHLLGDYTSDNSDFDGLAPFDRVVKDITNRIRVLSPSNPKGKAITQNIHRIESNSRIFREEKAQQIIEYLSRTLPDFIMTVEGGSIYRRLQKKDFVILSLEKRR